MPIKATAATTRPSRTSLASDSGMVFVDVWGSPEEFAAFAEAQISPAAGDSELPAFEPRFVPVHNHMGV
jgi:hypothetical protein